MTEQVRTISRERVVDRAGRVSPETLVAIRVWIRDFLDL
jgi:mRNA interferase MazF